MKHHSLIISVAVLLAACGGESKQAENTAPTTSYDKAVLTEEAKGAVKALGGTLKGELQTAMKAGGPINALGVCNTRAPEIAGSISAEKGLQISRVSLKNRNPDMGTPNEWQTAVLNTFEERKAAGEGLQTIAYSEVVEQDGKHEFRFMKAVPTGGVCLTCHGEAIAPEVSAKINELYPNDKATGYQAGDIRGAFVVVKALAQ